MSESGLARVYRRVRMAIAPGRISGSDDTGSVQKIQVTLGDGQVVDAVPAMYIWGLAVRPIAGADVVFLAGQGDRGNGCIVAVNDQRWRITGLAEGEVCLHDDLGRKVFLSRAGIVIDGGGDNITIQNSPTISVSGAIHAAGAIIAGYGGGDQVGLQTHTHTQAADSHGDTEAPTSAPTAGT